MAPGERARLSARLKRTEPGHAPEDEPELSEAGSTDDPGEEASARTQVGYALGALSTILPVGLFAAGPDGDCWYVNQRLIDASGMAGLDSGSFAVDLASVGSTPPAAISPASGGAPALLRVVPGTGAEGPPEGAGPQSDGTGTLVRGVELALNASVIRQVRHDGSTAGYLGMVVEPPDTGAGRDVTAATGPNASLQPPLFLHASEPLVQTLLDSTPDVITVFNNDGSWRFSNAAAWRLFGYQESFDARLGVFNLIHPDDTVAAVERFAQIVQGGPGPSDPFELRVRGQDGTWRLLENNATNLTGEPVVNGIVVCSRDVTEQRVARSALQEANERLSTLVGSLHIPALVEDESRVIVLTNNAFLDLFQLTGPPSKLLGKRLSDIGTELTRRFGDPTAGVDPERVNKILRERRRILGDRLSMPDGGELERDYVPIYVDHEYRGHLWLFRDVSAQVRTEIHTSELLADERRENRRLVKQEQVKASFLAEISHELRTPLTSILSFTELLRDGIGHDEAIEQVEFLDIITRNADRLMRLVDDLILLDRAESGALAVEWEAVDVPTMIEASVITFGPQAEAKRISLEMEVSEGISITGDSQKLAQMLEVLLANAIKFTPEDGDVTVTASPADAHWLISVSDTGIGVPGGELDALFDRFFRASNARAARIPGSGLGLSVARAIAELHDGEVSITSKDGEGTTAMVAIPFVNSKAALKTRPS
ncbi:MAG: PAS domain-containing sensor histidine kinase [Acidimicrobiales bacterium]